jgi:hypothetical protein
LFELHKRIQDAALAPVSNPTCACFIPTSRLARCRDVSPQTIHHPFLRSHAGFDAGMVRIESYHLNSSQLGGAGSVYTHELVCPCRQCALFKINSVRLTS